jgi:hypothetical protein
MNQAIAAVDSHSWLLFWGSDDFAPSPVVINKLNNAVQEAERSPSSPDLIVCRGRYTNDIDRDLGREASFVPMKGQWSLRISARRYRQLLFLGATPPHQATLFSPKVREYISQFSPSFRLSADLEYFLRISRCPGLIVNCIDLELVHMGDAGISGRQTRRRLLEVWRAYFNAFGILWWFPFMLRYVRRSASLLIKTD